VSPPRVVVLGAGAVGAACARALADAGARVRVIDPGAGRAAASWAAAGILSPSHPEELPDALHDLGTRSRGLWDGIARRHPEVELRRTGLVLLGNEPAWTEWRERRGLAVEPAPGRPGAVLFPEVAVVRSPRVAPALLGDIPVEREPPPPLEALRAGADLVVIATGAWAEPWLGELGVALEVAPRRGQMKLFASGAPEAVVMEPGEGHLAVPRADGRVIVGTTLEDVGFEVRTLAEDMERMEAWARRTLPGLGSEETRWAGLRPWSSRPAPTIGEAAPGVIVAVGHFRNGLLLAPATGELVADLALGRPPRVDPAPFAVDAGPGPPPPAADTIPR
jgi:glycine oxidase